MLVLEKTSSARIQPRGSAVTPPAKHKRCSRPWSGGQLPARVLPGAQPGASPLPEAAPRLPSAARKIPCRRAWQPTPVFLPGESHGQRNLVGYSPWGRKESDMTDTFPFKSRCSPRGWYWGAGDLGGGILLEPWARCYGWMSGEGLSCCHSQRCPGIRVKHGTGTLETSPTHGLLPSFAGAGGQPDYLHFTGAAGPGSLDSSRNLLITEAGGVSV